MEALLSHSFDYLSSYDPNKVRKGLRQVEGLLAQICLSRGKQTAAAEKRRSMASAGNQQSSPKALDELPADPAFREFYKLQESFQWNVAMRLVSCLEHLLDHGNDGSNDLLIVAALNLIHGVLLLHPPSRTIFSRENNMNLLLDLLDPGNCPAVQSATLLALVSALLDQPANTRTFEEVDGLLTVTSLFKSRSTSREVKLKLVEFLYFYLMPETPNTTTSSPSNGAGLHRSPSKAASTLAASDHRMGRETRTTDDKQRILGRYLHNVADFVEDLKETAPFGAI